MHAVAVLWLAHRPPKGPVTSKRFEFNDSESLTDQKGKSTSFKIGSNVTKQAMYELIISSLSGNARTSMKTMGGSLPDPELAKHMGGKAIFLFNGNRWDLLQGFETVPFAAENAYIMIKKKGEMNKVRCLRPDMIGAPSWDRICPFGCFTIAFCW
eukprot:GHVU01205367.1.p1 GENE.GHVU01205367.1~~GHVU01205367.1.p1  ORF type:complete len:155 (-),score=5.99 GHVU01205367.1:489-953(-)